ncbi:hypothetical protein ES703_57117 [subsurface metagenome]
MYRGEKLVDAPTTKALSDPRVIDVYLGRPTGEGEDAEG